MLDRIFSLLLLYGLGVIVAVAIAVLLPEMPFSAWLADSREVDPAVAERARTTYPRYVAGD